jgi:hypothetical protein
VVEELASGTAANAVSPFWGDFGGCMACLPGMSLRGLVCGHLLTWLSERIV